MRKMLPTTEQKPQMTPQSSVAFHDDVSRQSGSSAICTAVMITPTTKMKIPRERGLRAKSLKTKSLNAAKPRQ